MFKPFDKQRKFLELISEKNHLNGRKNKYLLYGGGMGGGKTQLGAYLFIQYAMQYPNSRIGVFRRNVPALMRTTHNTFIDVAQTMGIIEKKHYNIHRRDNEWHFKNGSEIYFMPLDHSTDPDFVKMRGLELSAAFIDEANEVLEEAFNILALRIGRANGRKIQEAKYIIDNNSMIESDIRKLELYKNLEIADFRRAMDELIIVQEEMYEYPPFIMLTCNPSNNWVKRLFYDPYRRGREKPRHRYIQSLPADNPYVSNEYLKQFKDMSIGNYKRYYEGDWNFEDSDSHGFQTQSITAAISKVYEHTLTRRTQKLGIDVAREGKDNTVFCHRIDNVIYDIVIPKIDKKSKTPILHQVAEQVVAYATKHNIKPRDVVIDTIGVGAGLYDALIVLGFKADSYKASNSSSDPKKYYDKRSESYYNLMKLFERNEIIINETLLSKKVSGKTDSPVIYDELLEDLINHEIDTDFRLIKFESKKDMRKRMARSPDFSDAVAQAFHKEPRRIKIHMPT